MEELDKEIKASGGSLDLEREKDGVGGSEKRKYKETQSVKIATFGQPLRKHAKLENSSKVKQAQAEDDDDEEEQNRVGYFEISNLYEKTCKVLPYDPDDYKYEDDPFLEEVERHKINQTKLSQEQVSDDDDLWSSEEEEEIQGDQFDKKDDEEEDGTEEEEEDDDNDEKDDRCLNGTSPCRSCKESGRSLPHWSENIEQFCKLVLERPDIKDGSNAEQVYRRMKEANLTRTMHKPNAIYLINYAIRYFSKDKGRQLSKSVEKLISLLPCITIKNGNRLEYSNFVESCSNFGIRDAKDVGHCLFEIFLAVERISHPLIRKKNIKDIIWICKRNAKVERRNSIQKCISNPFPFTWDALREDREERISQEALQDAFHIVQLHQDFDCHLASCSFLSEKSKIKELMSDENVVTSRFKKLDASLIKASLRGRVRLLKKISEYKRYVAWVRPIMELKANTGYTILDSVLEAVREVRPDFPNLSQECIIDQRPEEFSSFCELLNEIKRYLNCPVSHRYLIEGILAYMEICSVLGKTKTKTKKKKAFAEFQTCFEFRLHALDKVWGTRHYEHPAYNTLFGP